jgi:hypothetical protein
MHELIQQWLTERSPAEEVATPLSVPLGEVRSRNGAQLVKFWTTYAPLLSALVRRQNEAVTPEVRQAWGSPAETRDGFFTRARDSGWLDFRALDDQAIAKWLERAGMWPANKPADPTASAWGLSEESLRSVEDRANADSAARQRRRTQVEFAGASLSALKEDCASIVEAVASHTADAPALKSASGKDKEPSLETMQGARSGGSGGGHSGKGAARSPENSMSDEQKWGVGFIGELWAREWLRVRHQLDVVDESVWVSRYRDLVLNTTGGADSLGYDFLVSTKSRSYYYEVKASTGDPQRFEMGPTEIGAAQRYRADREHRYRILYLANVGDPKRMTATLLPNPFSIATADKFRAIGKGSVVYEFEPSKQMSE